MTAGKYQFSLRFLQFCRGCQLYYGIFASQGCRLVDGWNITFRHLICSLRGTAHWTRLTYYGNEVSDLKLLENSTYLSDAVPRSHLAPQEYLGPQAAMERNKISERLTAIHSNQLVGMLAYNLPVWKSILAMLTPMDILALVRASSFCIRPVEEETQI
jgi:hypothetical protein